MADIVAGAPATIAVFQRHAIAFCCAGRVPLRVVCEKEGLDLPILLDELIEATHPFTDTGDWAHAPLPDIVAHIKRTYHEPLYRELPRLRAMLAKVVSRHGDRLADTLLPLRATFAELEEDLVLHMQREDAILFPTIVEFTSRLDFAVAGPHPLAGPIAVMEQDHAHAEDALASIRELTRGYEAPADACPTFRGLYHGLGDLEHRMRLHVHLENDILFPRTLELGRPAAAAGLGVG